MTETTEMQSTALVTLDPVQYVTETFAPFRTKLEEATALTIDVVYDVTTKDGMAKAKECRNLFKSIRLSAEEMRKQRKAPILEIGKLLDSHYKEIESQASTHEDLHHKAIKAEEERQEAIKAEQIRIEQERKAAIDTALAKLANAPANGISMDAAGVAALLDEVRATEITEDVFGDRNVEAENAKFKAIDALQQLHTAKVAQETQAKIEADRAAAEASQKAEDFRVSNIKTKIMLIENAIATAAMLESSVEVQAVIDNVDRIVIDASFAEFKDEAEGVKARVLKALARTLNMVQGEEAERAKEAQAQQINEAKPEVAQREAVTLPGQDQVSEKQSSLAPQTEQAFNDLFSNTKAAPSSDEIVSLVADHYGVTDHQARTWLNDLFYVMAA